MMHPVLRNHRISGNRNVTDDGGGCLAIIRKECYFELFDDVSEIVVIRPDSRISFKILPSHPG